MRAPQVVIVEYDGWIARHLGDLAAESAWLIRNVRNPDSAMQLVRKCRPCVLIVQVEPADDKPAPLGLIADVGRTSPDVPVVAVSDVKLNDADRVAWTAALFDLGARYVLFPPLTKPVLEDLASGLMPGAALGPAAPGDEVIDLADEDDE